EAEDLAKKMTNQDFNFDDYLKAMEQMKKLGPINKLLEMIPGVNAKELGDLDLSNSEKEIDKVKAIIYSMSDKERKNPNLLNGSNSRKLRIAKGSGTTMQDVNKLIKGHGMMKKQMKQFKSLTKGPGKKGLLGKMPFMK
ncbi:MAG: signal recognition particle protein, partial [Sarcina sp.]